MGSFSVIEKFASTGDEVNLLAFSFLKEHYRRISLSFIGLSFSNLELQPFTSGVFDINIFSYGYVFEFLNAAVLWASRTAVPDLPGVIPYLYQPTLLVLPDGTSIFPSLVTPTPSTTVMSSIEGM
jgi:hypothetical protein